MKADSFGTFFVPGPTEVRPEVLAAMSGPMIPHRSKAFEDLYAEAQIGLKEVFLTNQPVLISCSSATGMMEAAVRSVPSGKILGLVNGAFSTRFARIAQMCGREIDEYAVEWGESHDSTELKKRLVQGKYSAVLVVHSETSTGALNDVRAISSVAHEHDALCMIDSVSGLAGAELRFDEWGLDFVLTGSQKALALPPGLGFATVSQRMLDLARSAPARGAYFDIVELEQFARQSQTPSTPAVSLFYALCEQLSTIRAEGIEARWKRHLSMTELVTRWIDITNAKMDLSMRRIAASPSPTVSTIELGEAVDMAAFMEGVRARGIVLGGGYGKLKNSTFRIGHMGDHTAETVQRCLDACSITLEAVLAK